MKTRYLLYLLLLIIPWGGQANGEKDLEGEYRFYALRLERRSSEALRATGVNGLFSFGEDDSFLVDSERRHAYAKESGGIAVLDGFLEGFGAFDARVTSNSQALMGVTEGFGGGSVAVVVAVRPARDVPSSAIFRDSYQAALVAFPAGSGGAGTVSFGSFEAAQSSLILSADGTGTLTVPPGSGLSATEFQVAASENGELIIGAPSTTAGFLVAMRKEPQSPQGLLWLTEVSLGRGGPAAAVGGLVLSGPNRARIYERWFGPRGLSDYRGENAFILQPDGRGSLDATTIVSGAGGALIGAVTGVGTGALLFGLPAPALSDGKVFANPQGNVSAASLSPAGDPAAPSQLRSLFGIDLATVSAAAESLPLPTSLQGSSITVNGAAAPLLFVSPGQVNFQIPPDASGPSVRIAAQSGAETSDEILGRLAASSAAVFTLDGSGAGAGIFTHADFSLVNSQAPARPGEIVVAFLTGLGVGQPPPRVWVGGLAAEVTFAGPAPGFAGLDQMNFRIPLGTQTGPAVPFSIATREGWSDTVSIAIEL